jgi:hypothetical protein
MVDQRKPKKAFSLGVGLCLVSLALASFSCKNPTSGGQAQPSITVNNGSGIALDIYMDGNFQFYLNDNEYYIIQNVSLGTHLLEAKKKDTGILMKSYTANIEANSDYIWTIVSGASLKITNHYGETLDIYGDGTYQTDIPDQSDLVIPTIPYGEHLIEAKIQGGTTVVASTTFEIMEDITYTWVIEK